MSFLKRLFGRTSISRNAQQGSRQAGGTEGLPAFDYSKRENIEARLTLTLDVLEPFKRTAYVPHTKPRTTTYLPESKFGGLPYLRHAADWPLCPICNRPMQFFLQLNHNTLPKDSTQGLTQLFYCVNYEPKVCEDVLESQEPFSRGSVCRIIEIDGPSATYANPPTEVLDELAITWEPVDDFPHDEEYKELHIEVDDDVRQLMKERKMGVTLQRDKLLGWPYWIQGREYPFDRITGSRMDHVFQFNSAYNLPDVFGDAWMGYLTQSPDNENEMAFSWHLH